MCFNVLLNALVVAISSVSSLQPTRRGPSFSYEPPGLVDFSNGTGTVIPCSALGNPTPVTKWALGDGTPVSDIPGLRHVRPDGSLVFPPFRSDDFRRDVHFNVYRCIASSALGTIGSRDVRVRGVLRQKYSVEVRDEYVLAGNTAVLSCKAPESVAEFLTVTSWLEEPTSTVIQPAGTVGGRYLILPSGELYVRNVQVSHSHRTYSCTTRHRLTGDVVESKVKGTLVVTESKNGVSPRIVDFRPRIVIRQGETLTLPCAAQAYPIPEYHWFKAMSNKRLAPLGVGERALQLDGTLVLYRTTIQDAATYVCWVNNSLGEEKAHTEVIITVPLSVSVRPSVLRADLGGSAYLNCTVSGHPLVSVEWKKDMRPLTAEQRIKRLSGGEIMRISPVHRQDRAMYQCIARNEHETAQAALELTLGEDSPSLEEAFEERILEPGPAVSLKCVANGSPLPQVTWTLDGAPPPESPRLRIGDFVTSAGTVVSYLNNSAIRVEDGGLYRCTADNGVGVAQHAAQVRVVGPPIVRHMENVTAVAGETLTVHCPATGYPLERVYWERERTALPFNHRQKVYENGTMELHHVDRSPDEGPYTCLARNPEGKIARGTLHVKVQVKPVIEPFSFPKSLREGQRSSIMCTVANGDLPISIKWFKDERPLATESSGIRIAEAADYSSTLLFKSLRLEHRGNYTCEASNEAGTVKHTATMIIHVAPRWTIEPSDVAVVRSRGAVVDCQAQGFPQPRIRWTKSSQGTVPGEFKAIASSPHLQVYENGSLSILESQEEDAGFYLCQANNNIGQGLSKVVRITVQVAAHFRSKFSAEMVRRGQAAKMKCQAFGDKPIAVTWFKDKKALSPGADSRYELLESVLPTGVTSEIIIGETERRDSALYQCTASNAHGEDDTNIQLIVQESPDSPVDVKVSEAASRTARVEWVAPYNGNSVITQYVTQFKEEAAKWHSKANNVSVQGTDTWASLGGLKPAHIYNIRVFADNRIGRSQPSRTLELMTFEEAPGGPPLKVRITATSSKSLRVTWRSPSKDLLHGKLTGYYVGYKQFGSKDPYVYKTLEPAKEAEVHLTGLKRHTKYAIIVQAFNAKGAGPASEETTAETLQNDPPASPQLEVSATTHNSVRLVWNPTTDDNPITGYLLYHRGDESEWQETRLEAGTTTQKVEPLACGCVYHFFLRAYNTAGKGEPCETVSTKTQGSVPVAPEPASSAVQANNSWALIKLSSWEDGGCPIESFLVRHKPQRLRSWTNEQRFQWTSDNSDYFLVNLTSGVQYDLQVVAANSAGLTETEISFSTLANKVVQRNGVSALTSSWTIVVIPIVVSALVVILLLLVVCAILRRKRAADGAAPGTYGFRKSVIPDSVQLSELQEVRKVPPTLNTLPYDKSQDNGYHSDEPLYATVKRTPRPPRTDANIYHCTTGLTVQNNGRMDRHKKPGSS